MSGYSPPDSLVAALLSEEVYHSGGEVITAPPGWAEIGNYYDPNTGYYGEAWEKYTVSSSGAYLPVEIMQVNRGTVFTTGPTGPQNVPASVGATGAIIDAVNLGDTASSDFYSTVGTDAAILVGGSPSYLASANSFYQRIDAQYSTVPIIEVGQSLGGATSDAVVAENDSSNINLSAMTFNALIYTNGNAGISAAAGVGLPIKNYYVSNEILTQNTLSRNFQWITGGTQVGTNILLPSLLNLSTASQIFGNFQTIHSTSAAITQMFRALYTTPSSPLYTSPSIPTLDAAGNSLRSAFPDYPANTPSSVVDLLGTSGTSGTTSQTTPAMSSNPLSLADNSPAAPADDPSADYTDTTTGQKGTVTEGDYSGLDQGLSYQLVASGDDNMVFLSPGQGSLIQTGNGDDAITVLNGNNVIDAGAGSSFITSGTGSDLIVLGAPGASDVWNTIVNFHPGDTLAILGYQDGATNLQWLPTGSGAAGYQGLTLDVTTGASDERVTFTGLTAADISSLVSSSGAIGGTAALYITRG